ncbi:ROK family protein [Mycoplasma iguanae]|uniref:ROK family protein n=1 Tax=Mycoplasma iguanae TaxID=292461 RepID=A0ABY5R8P5_9MOLU|nr:ROK family protein [Mycoplasma iguanae]UVD81874.1 ROK family protein [Mycoplasma iguanae]
MKKIITLDIGGTNIKYGIINKNYEFIYQEKSPTKTANIFLQVKNIIENLLEKYADICNQIAGIALATTGAVDSKERKIAWTNSSMSFYKDTDFSLLEKIFNLPVILENDANSAAFSEKIFDEYADNYAFVTLGTGVGIGIIKENKLFSGSNYLGGELGYLKYGDQYLDQYLSFTKQSNEMKNQFDIHINEHAKFNNLYLNNEKFKNFMDDYFDKIVKFTVQLAMFLNLDKIFISGGFSYIEKKYFKTVQEKFQKALAITPFKTRLILAKSQNNAGMLGVSYLMFNKGNDEKN